MSRDSSGKRVNYIRIKCRNFLLYETEVYSIFVDRDTALEYLSNFSTESNLSCKFVRISYSFDEDFRMAEVVTVYCDLSQEDLRDFKLKILDV